MTPEFVKTIVVDVDGVLYAWSKTARYMLRTYRGHSRSGPMGRESTHWDYIKDNVSPADWDWLWTEAIDLGLFRHGHVVRDGIVALKALREAGYTLHALTHRPKNAKVKLDTMQWIEFHFPATFAKVTITGHEVSKSEYEEGFLLIDDSPRNVTEWRASSRPAFLFDAEWNREADDPFRVRGWLKVLDRLKVGRP